MHIYYIYSIYIYIIIYSKLTCIVLSINTQISYIIWIQKTYVSSMAAYVEGLNPYVIRPVLKPRSPTFASPAWLQTNPGHQGTLRKTCKHQGDIMGFNGYFVESNEI